MQTAGADPARRRALVAAALLALGLHAALLGGLDDGGARPGPTPAGAVQVRTIVPAVPPPTAPEPPPMSAAAPTPPVVKPKPSPPRRVAAAEVPAESPVERSAGATVATPVEAAPAAAEPAASAASEAAEAPAGLASAALAAASAPLPAAGGEPPPLYRTRLPPAATLRYELQRGRLAGSGELLWRPQQGGRYELTLQGSVVGLRVLTQVSQGRLDEHGLAPERFTDQRVRRPMLAANFRRDSGRISFSGPSQELPLWPGVQDRLSWMIQLAAVVAGEPARWVAGERIVLQVVGARGDAGPWAFEIRGTQDVDTPSGPVAALHLTRQPRGPFDTTVEVWLDPARHHLPVRATLRSGEDDRLELRLREWVPGP